MQITMLKVLYEDNHLIAVLKPAGLLVQGDASGAISLMDIVKDYLKEKYNKPGDVFLGLVHRLDRPVSGIVLFAKTSKGASRVSEQFREREVSKNYTAILEGVLPKDEGKLEVYIKKDEKLRKAYVFDNMVEDAQNAVLSYKVLRREKDVTWAKIGLHTGRFHQIRATFAHIGHPILGDKKYGAKMKYREGEIALSATELSFKTATGEKEIHLQLDPIKVLDLGLILN
jgi:23S rRNA pseudouridine1911/1915/1917 synthase